jgi:hypothetical protein
VRVVIICKKYQLYIHMSKIKIRPLFIFILIKNLKLVFISTGARIQSLAFTKNTLYP